MLSIVSAVDRVAIWHAADINPADNDLVDLYHWTWPSRANHIVKTRQWHVSPYDQTPATRPVQMDNGWITDPDSYASFTDWGHMGRWSGFGDALVHVRVPRNVVHKRDRPENLTEYGVKLKDLNGVPVRRVPTDEWLPEMPDWYNPARAHQWPRKPKAVNA